MSIIPNIHMMDGYKNEAISAVRQAAGAIHLSIVHIPDDTINDWLSFASYYDGKSDNEGNIISAKNILLAFLYFNGKKCV